MNETLKKIEETRIVLVVVLEDVNDAAPLANALCNGGLACAEVTFRTAEAAEVLKKMKEARPDMLVGAGTVLSTKQVDEAVEAGAEFIVSPGLNPDVVSYCVSRGITIIPGCANPSDIEQALKYNLDVVKFFPAEALGGLKLIKAMSAPYKTIKFMPTGGINPKNVKEYLDCKAIIACGGTWMVPHDAVANKDFAQIEKLTKEAVAAIQG